ncbi:MAG: hypothetical protein RCG15_02210 [Candidatus Rickettsia vulgarisii]
MTKNGNQNEKHTQKSVKELVKQFDINPVKPKGKVQKAVEKYEAKIAKPQEKKGKSSSWLK